MRAYAHTRFVRRALHWLIALAAWLSVAAPPNALYAQNPTPTQLPLPYAQKVNALLRSMSVNQKIGQLFLISAQGNLDAARADLTDLIVNYRVGGIQLRAVNQNFANGADGIKQFAEFANFAQTTTALSGTVNISGTTQAISQTASFVPMWVAVAQEGDGAPFSELTQGATQLPSEMAIGATWKPTHAESVGRVLGNELSRIGVNTLLGPTLDVLDTPRPNSVSDPGTRVFGGDPFWVGQMGAAYISGVHSGSNNRIAVIAKNFPGLGAADRNIEDEIPTVQKSLEQLKQIELAPFFNVLQYDAKGKSTSADGLLVSHIRYRGFQGNIRASTRPVSLDPQAYKDLMTLPEIAPWRNGGGVTFSDALGVRSVRRFYDPNEATFNARRIAQDAFNAGNDVLILGNFSLNNSPQEQIANIKDTILFFRAQYTTDQQFAQRVDAAVSRILALKLKMYGGDFAVQQTLTNPDNALTLPEDRTRSAKESLQTIAKDSITLLSPSARDLPALIPAPPGKDDTLLFITDDRQLRDCARCAPYSAIGRTALQDIALNLYGARATQQLNANRVTAFTFTDLDNLMRATPADLANIITSTQTTTQTAPVTPTADAAAQARQNAARLQTAIDQSNWIIISLIDLNPAVKNTQALRDFLAKRGDALRDKRIVMFAFGAPYQLDSTEINKTTAYYGVYSRMQPSLEAAVRALFGEFAPSGYSPVSINALSYSLLTQTAPNPAQVIALSAGETITQTGTPAPLELKIGDRLKLRAGPILDRNSHIVPDGTPVQFTLSYPAERVDQQQPPTTSTHNGFAETTVVIERKGNLEVRAQSDQANTSFTIKVNIGDNSASIETIRPTQQPSPQPSPSTAPTVKPSDTPSATPVPPAAAPVAVTRANFASFVTTLLMLLALTLSALMILNGSMRFGILQRWRAVLWSWSAAWLAYAAVAFGLPVASRISIGFNWFGAVIVAISAAVVVLLASLIAQLSRR